MSKFGPARGCMSRTADPSATYFLLPLQYRVLLRYGTFRIAAQISIGLKEKTEISIPLRKVDKRQDWFSWCTIEHAGVCCWYRTFNSALRRMLAVV